MSNKKNTFQTYQHPTCNQIAHLQFEVLHHDLHHIFSVCPCPSSRPWRPPPQFPQPNGLPQQLPQQAEQQLVEVPVVVEVAIEALKGKQGGRKGIAGIMPMKETFSLSQ